MRRRLTAIVGGAVTLLAIAGCGPFGGGSSEEEVRAAVTEFIEAGQARDYEAVCELLSEDQVAALDQRGGCQAVLAQQANPLAEDVELRIEEVRIEGDRANVDVTFSRPGAGSEAASLLLVEEGGEWKVGSAGL